MNTIKTSNGRLKHIVARENVTRCKNSACDPNNKSYFLKGFKLQKMFPKRFVDLV